jgi:Fic family protein
MIQQYELDFIRESNRIEGILREPTQAEIDAYVEFMQLDELTITNLEKYVKAIQPNAVLRQHTGLDVRVGNYYPPKGGQKILHELANLLDRINEDMFMSKCDIFKTHVEYEQLHPFTDGNGRSGRMIWWWQMKGSQIGFLHQFYYQTLTHLQTTK